MGEDKQTAPQAEAAAQLTVRNLFGRESVQKKFEAMLGKKAPGFISSVLQLVSSSKDLSKVDPLSIYNAAATAATLDLPINNSLGFAWIVPYNGMAQFQIGWKGYVQLAQRSAQYSGMNAGPVHASQFISWEPLRETLVVDLTIEPSGGVVGYFAYFGLMNGFTKMAYWTHAQVTAHAQRYSKAFKFAKSGWQTDFDKMAQKTVLSNTIRSWGPMSIEMQTAITVDQGVIRDPETLDIDYVDNPENETPEERAQKLKDAAEQALKDDNK